MAIASAQTHNLDLNDFFRQTVSGYGRHVIKQYLIDSEAEFGRVQAEINRLKARMTALETKGMALQRRMAGYRSLLSPIHRMPPEILVHIFGFYCAEGHIGAHEDPAAIVLSKVCGRWREIALVTPRLWCTISLQLDEWFGQRDMQMTKMKRMKRMANLYLDRSKTAPISLKLDSPHLNFMPRNQLDRAATAIARLVEKSDRWVEFSCTHQILGRPAFHRNITGHLSAVERLDVYGQVQEPGYDSPFTTCPSLTSLTIAPDSCHQAGLPWHQIISLCFRRSFITNALDILSSCTSISRLELQSIAGSEDDFDPDSHERVVLPVRHLILSSEDEEEATSIFKSSTFPSLSTLEIRNPSSEQGEWTHLDLSPIKDFLARSSCTLTSLSLDGVPLSDTETVSLLKTMPALTSLCVREQRNRESGKQIVTEAFIKLFSAYNERPRSEPFLPSLRDLTLGMHYSSTSQSTLLGVIASRAPDPQDTVATSIARLQTFNLNFMANEDLDVADLAGPWQCFRDAGLCVHISYMRVE